MIIDIEHINFTYLPQWWNIIIFKFLASVGGWWGGAVLSGSRLVIISSKMLRIDDDNMELPFDLRDWKQTHAAFLLIIVYVNFFSAHVEVSGQILNHFTGD